MTRTAIHFSDVLSRVIEALWREPFPEKLPKPLLIRDIFGRVSVGFDATRADFTEWTSRLDSILDGFSPFIGQPPTLFSDDLFEPELIFSDAAIVDFVDPISGRSVRLLERQITGQDWSLLPRQAEPGDVPQLSFFGLKGGVGRSTALSILAYELAKKGKRVLLIDLDLESPGLSGLLLPRERQVEFGVVDWLIEDSVGQSDSILEQIVSSSPLADSTPGEIRVVSAMGNSDCDYVAKLSRIYSEVSIEGRSQRFSERISRLVQVLKIKESPEVVLIDSRAGLHDLAGLSIVSLSTASYLFATNGAQAWDGLRALFSYWQRRPVIARGVRERLKLVSALFPESDQVRRTREFLERAHSLFAETLYDEVAPGPTEVSAREEPFNFSLNDTEGPHFPLRINWNSRFQEFDPLLIPLGLFNEYEIRAAYGEFLDSALQSIEDVL
jgi:cellulose biosynthesis protein BcsQ